MTLIGGDPACSCVERLWSRWSDRCLLSNASSRPHISIGRPSIGHAVLATTSRSVADYTEELQRK